MCFCVFFQFILDIMFVGRTRRGHTGGRSHRRKVTQDFSSTFYLSAVRALIFLARRIQPFLSLVGREVEFCVLTIQSFSTRWAFLVLFFSFLVRKIPFAGIELTSQRVRGLRGTSELPGRPFICSRYLFFSCHRIISHDRMYVEQKERIGGQVLLNAKTIINS